MLKEDIHLNLKQFVTVTMAMMLLTVQLKAVDQFSITKHLMIAQQEQNGTMQRISMSENTKGVTEYCCQADRKKPGFSRLNNVLGLSSAIFYVVKQCF